MPAFQDIFAAAPLPKPGAGGDQGLLAGLLQGQAHPRGRGTPGGADGAAGGGLVLLARGQRRPCGARPGLGSFLDQGSTFDAAGPARAARPRPPAGHADFIFGGGAAASRRRHAAPGTLPLEGRWQAGKAAVLDLTPRLAMMAGSTAAWDALKKSSLVRRLDPFGHHSSDDSELRWSSRLLVRNLRLCLASDAFSAMVILSTLRQQCDSPLRLWLLGGMALGFPVDYFVNKVVQTRPSFAWYRLKVTSTRTGADPKTMKFGGLVLYDQFKVPIDEGFIESYQDGEYFFAKIVHIEKQLVTSYRVVTSADESPGLDPVGWVLEGSRDGVLWELMDEVDDGELPWDRGVATEAFDDLYHLEDATVAFRGAFLLEVAATGASFGWLVAGTSWVSAATETCVDSAPLLWYSCYFYVAIMWSLILSGFVMIIASGFANVVFKQSPPRQEE